MNALIIVDVQNDFLPGGSLEVENGDQVIPIINRLIPHFDLAVATQDWHPGNHGSFASNNNAEPFSEGTLNGVDQIYWPDHCVQGSRGAEINNQIDLNRVSAIIRKGMDPKVDSYSGFFDNKRQHRTGLNGYLKEHDVDTVHVVGLAADVCVHFTAMDALDLGYKTVLVEDAIKGLNSKDVARCKNEFAHKGGMIMDSTAMLSGS